MNKKASLLHIAGLVLIVAIASFLFFYGPSFDFEGPLELGRTNPCVVSLETSNFNLTEGDNVSTKMTFFTEETGTFNIGFEPTVPFAVVDTPFVAQPFQNTTYNLFFINATPYKKGDKYKLGWEDTFLKIEGPSGCSAKFNLLITDNCVAIYNPDQSDVDNDGIGDVCDDQICGNDLCEAGENNTNCCSDCGCLAGQICESNECLGAPFACVYDTDCDDNAECSRDVCLFKNTTGSYCIHQDLTRCSEDKRDGCCPIGCNANIDLDCDPNCGNDICEDFYGKEDFIRCSEDCESEED